MAWRFGRYKNDFLIWYKREESEEGVKPCLQRVSERGIAAKAV